MASFIPNHRKKKDRLAKLESELQRLIARGASREELLQAASELREGRIRVLRAKQNQNPERSDSERAVFVKHAAEIAALRELPAEVILAEYLRPANSTTDLPKPSIKTQRH
jgi:hypothetical protein